MCRQQPFSPLQLYITTFPYCTVLYSTYCTVQYSTVLYLPSRVWYSTALDSSLQPTRTLHRPVAHFIGSADRYRHEANPNSNPELKPRTGRSFRSFRGPSVSFRGLGELVKRVLPHTAQPHARSTSPARRRSPHAPVLSAGICASPIRPAVILRVHWASFCIPVTLVAFDICIHTDRCPWHPWLVHWPQEGHLFMCSLL